MKKWAIVAGCVAAAAIVVRRGNEVINEATTIAGTTIATSSLKR